MTIQKTFGAMLTDSRVISFFPPEHILEQWRAELSPREVFLKCASFQRRLKLQMGYFRAFRYIVFVTPKLRFAFYKL